MSTNGDGAEPQRPRLVLKPRDEQAAKAAELERKATGKNPFGDAKPREAILASRTGKSEVEILKEEVKHEHPRLRLSPQQLEEKSAAEAAVAETQSQLDKEQDETKCSALKVELQTRQEALEELLAKFENAALEAAMKGEAPRMSERRQQQQQQQPAREGGYGGARGGGYTGGRGYGRGDKDRDRDEFRGRGGGFSDSSAGYRDYQQSSNYREYSGGNDDNDRGSRFGGSFEKGAGFKDYNTSYDRGDRYGSGGGSGDRYNSRGGRGGGRYNDRPQSGRYEKEGGDDFGAGYKSQREFDRGGDGYTDQPAGERGGYSDRGRGGRGRRGGRSNYDDNFAASLPGMGPPRSHSQSSASGAVEYVSPYSQDRY